MKSESEIRELMLEVMTMPYSEENVIIMTALKWVLGEREYDSLGRRYRYAERGEDYHTGKTA